MKENLKAVTILLRASRSVEEALRHDISKYGLNTAEFGVLEYLHHKGKKTMRDICSRLLMANSSMTYVIDKLEKKSFVKRLYDPSDRRVIFIDLTDEGKIFIEKVFPTHKMSVDDLFSILNTNEINQMMEILKKLGKDVERKNNK